MTPESIVLAVPDLADDRLRLRPWTVRDAASLVRAWHDPAIIEGSSPPDDRSHAAATRWIEGWELRRQAGLAFDVVVVGPDDEVVGEVGLSGFDTVRRAARIGWWVHADARGGGVASTAVALLTRWALGADGGLRALFAEMDAENIGSIVVARRAGYREIDDPRFPQERARGLGARVCYVATSTVK